MKFTSLVINILVLLIYSSAYSQDTTVSNNNSPKEVQFKRLHTVQQKYLHWVDKKNREISIGVPAIAYNKYDGMQIGAALINP